MRILKILVVVTMFLVITASCTKKSNWETYSADGLSIKYPPAWLFKIDQSYSQLADREVTFEISETSFAGVYLFDGNDSSTTPDITTFLNTLVERTLSEVRFNATTSYDTKNENFKNCPGERRVVKTDMFVGRETHILGCVVHRDKKTVFFVTVVDASLAESVSKSFKMFVDQ